MLYTCVLFFSCLLITPINLLLFFSFFFFLNDTATTEIYPLPLHDALPISVYIGAAGVLSPYLARFSEPGVPPPAFYLMLATLLLVAVMANITAIRRFIYIHAELRKREGAAPSAGSREEELSGWFQRAWIASAIATAVDYGSFTILVEVVGIYTGTSRALGAALGAVTNFTVNKVYTFRTRQNSVLVEVPRY